MPGTVPARGKPGTRPILFIAAEPRECAPWVARWTGVHELPLSVHWARAGMWQGRHVAAIANGAGADRAFAAVILASQVSAVCNIGFCGALDKALRVGDIFVGTAVQDRDRLYPALTPDMTSSPASGIVASIDHIARTAEEKSILRNSGASVVEMEAAGAARGAEDLGVPFYCIRAVSDLADENLANDFNAALTPDGRFSVPRLIAGALTSPAERFGELLRLQRRTVIAAKNLGDFLANCSF